ncbi:hypothetical protein MNBD_DELTA01-1709 [hydrothermal vent metagenome]|uniref:Uncharacterized protein n=1 Tax=hydrothermal vent metagenome TaxID=652676 RepID=A0A3B0RB50_9ZZZZ
MIDLPSVNPHSWKSIKQERATPHPKKDCDLKSFAGKGVIIKKVRQGLKIIQKKVYGPVVKIITTGP